MSRYERTPGHPDHDRYHVRPTRRSHVSLAHRISHHTFSHREIVVASSATLAAIGLATIAYVTLYSPSSESPKSSLPAVSVPVAQAADVEQDPTVERIIRHTTIFEGKLTLYPGIKYRSTKVADANTSAPNLVHINPITARTGLIITNPEIEDGGSATPWIETEKWAVRIPVKDMTDTEVQAYVNLGEQTREWVKLEPTSKERRDYQPAVLVQRGKDLFFKTPDGRYIAFTVAIPGEKEPPATVMPQNPPIINNVK